MLGHSNEPLCEAYDLAMLDLDGVLYVGEQAVPGAAQHVREVRSRGMRAAFITNNASRSPAAVAQHLRQLGVNASAADVVTSAQAAASLLARRLGPGGRVVALGASGLAEALREAGLVPVGAGDEAQALATGYGPDVPWRDIMRAAVAVRDGLPWVASNTDQTIPTSFGIAPGHGVLVDMLSAYAGVRPEVAGKPAVPLIAETIKRLGGRRPLMVGDRLDTDIEGAVNAGVDSLLVLTGVSGLGELVSARPGQRPTYISPDLAGLLVAHQGVVTEDATVQLGGWHASVVSARLEVTGRGAADDWWRVLAEAAWRSHDETGRVPDTAGLTPPPSRPGPGPQVGSAS